MTLTNQFFPDEEIFKNVSHGFMFMETFYPKWLINFHKKVGDKLTFDLDMESDELLNMIIKSGNIRSFLSNFIEEHDDNLIIAMPPDNYLEVGMIDKFTFNDKFEEYANAWSRMIKVYIIQGSSIAAKVQNTTLNEALKVDYLKADEVIQGQYYINIPTLMNDINPESLAALYVLFNSMTPDEFKKIIKDNSILNSKSLTMDNIVIISRLIGKFIKPKNTINATLNSFNLNLN